MFSCFGKNSTWFFKPKKVIILDGILVYNLPFFTSISESATTNNQTTMILPFGLGMMALFCYNYIVVMFGR